MEKKKKETQNIVTVLLLVLCINQCIHCTISRNAYGRLSRSQVTHCICNGSPLFSNKDECGNERGSYF